MVGRAAPSLLLPLLLLCGLIGSSRSSPSQADINEPAPSTWKRAPRRFQPSAYDHIQRAIRSAAAVAHKNREKPFASGVLIARDTVLTARHVTYKYRRIPGRAEPPRIPPTNLEVRFDYIQHEDGTLGPYATWPVVAYVDNARGEDWLLLKLGTNEHGELPAADRVQQLSTTRAKLDDPVFVVGFSNGAPMQIADDARILFPLEVTTHERREILHRAEPVAHTAIKRAYVEQPGGRYRKQGAQIGIDSDTLQGMSGGGVFLKRTGVLIGILVDGPPGHERGRPPGWTHHDRILHIDAAAASGE